MFGIFKRALVRKDVQIQLRAAEQLPAALRSEIASMILTNMYIVDLRRRTEGDAGFQQALAEIGALNGTMRKSARRLGVRDNFDPTVITSSIVESWAAMHLFNRQGDFPTNQMSEVEREIRAFVSRNLTQEQMTAIWNP